VYDKLLLGIACIAVLWFAWQTAQSAYGSYELKKREKEVADKYGYGDGE
jgi:hypothetical protein